MRVWSVLLLALMIALAGCTTDDSGGGETMTDTETDGSMTDTETDVVMEPQTHHVEVGDNSFTLKNLEINAGDTVIWTHAGGRPHTVTADDGSFDSHPGCGTGAMGGDTSCMVNGDTFTMTFDTAGSFPYYCRLHGGAGGVGMSGTITVV